MSTTVIYHRADFDGLFSAAVCKKFMPGAILTGWDFGDDLIEQPSGTTYIVDLSPDCLLDVVESQRIVWIDHHKSSIAKWGANIPGYRIDGVAACRLCWQWFRKHPSGGFGSDDPMHQCLKLPELDDYKNRKVAEPLALTLAGEYDVWDLRDDRALPFQFGLTARGANDHDRFFELTNLLQDAASTQGMATKQRTLDVVDEGRAAMGWQQAFAADVCNERSFTAHFEGLVFCALVSVHARNSMWFPAGSVSPLCDGLMCIRIEGDGYVNVSLYHSPHEPRRADGETPDLSEIAVKYGGGGHRGACGFQIPLSQALRLGLLGQVQQ